MMPPACRPGYRCPVSEVMAERPDNFWTALLPESRRRLAVTLSLCPGWCAEPGPVLVALTLSRLVGRYGGRAHVPRICFW
jgi:hypothetical protein